MHFLCVYVLELLSGFLWDKVLIFFGEKRWATFCRMWLLSADILAGNAQLHKEKLDAGWVNVPGGDPQANT